MEDKNLITSNIDENIINDAREWTPYYEDIFVEWCDKAMSYRYLHTNCHRYYYRLHVSFTIPVIFISTITGVANFAQERIPEEYQVYYTMCIGACNILAGFITTIAQFLKVNELSERHRLSSISWDKLHRNVKIEVTKNPKDRENIIVYLKKIKEQYDLLIETSPEIRLNEIIKFEKKFKNNSFLRPEICDSLVSTRESVYKDDKTQDEDLIVVQIIKEKRNNALNNLEIENFIKKYKLEHNREPSIDELYDNLGDKINNKSIEGFIENQKTKSAINNIKNK